MVILINLIKLLHMKNIDIKIEEENQALILLRSPSDFFDNFINSILYDGKDTISLPNVQVYFKLYRVNNKNEKGSDDQAKSLFIRCCWENA
jgi:hypothetical protein